MKRTVLSIALGSAALAACVPTRNLVSVDVSGAPGVSGVVMLCDQETALIARGERLTAAVPITCEGGGEVRLRFEDGTTATCQIGYVSAGLNQEFLFELEHEECVPILKVR